MAFINATSIYNALKFSGHTKYNQETHCKLALTTIGETGRVTQFCAAAVIGRTTYNKWLIQHPIFKECAEIAMAFAQEMYEVDFDMRNRDDDFNLSTWKFQTERLFSHLKTKLYLDIKADATPWEQYQQILVQSTQGDFSASEIKQLMESVNVGTRVYESFKLQTEVDKMKDDLNTMSQRSGNNIVPINKATTND